jgi:hypothetical protein
MINNYTKRGGKYNKRATDNNLLQNLSLPIKYNVEAVVFKYKTFNHYGPNNGEFFTLALFKEI